MSFKFVIYCDVNGRVVGFELKVVNVVNGLIEDGDEGFGVELYEEIVDFNLCNDGIGFLDVCFSGD